MLSYIIATSGANLNYIPKRTTGIFCLFVYNLGSKFELFKDRRMLSYELLWSFWRYYQYHIWRYGSI